MSLDVTAPLARLRSRSRHGVTGNTTVARSRSLVFLPTELRLI
ncbi:MAG: hypothetical protein SW833_07795 [Cyanobacteriota bacterium]|nr:hypothetical protein [Cyanobacteriota bacterium]